MSPSSASASGYGRCHGFVALDPGAVHALDVDQDLRKLGHHRGQVLQRTAGECHLSGNLQAGEDAVAGCGVVGEDHVSGLLAAEVEAAFAHPLQDVAVADAGFAQADAGLAQCDLESEVAHDGSDEDVVVELA